MEFLVAIAIFFEKRQDESYRQLSKKLIDEGIKVKLDKALEMKNFKPSKSPKRTERMAETNFEFGKHSVKTLLSF